VAASHPFYEQLYLHPTPSRGVFSSSSRKRPAVLRSTTTTRSSPWLPWTTAQTQPLTTPSLTASTTRHAPMRPSCPRIGRYRRSTARALASRSVAATSIPATSTPRSS